MHVTNGSIRQTGVTLIEQILVIAIVGILASVAVPPLHKLLGRNTLQSTQMDYIAGLQHARGTAVMTGTHTVFCPTRDGRQCTDEAMWDQGWLIGRDRDNDNQPDGGPLYIGLSGRGRIRVRSSDGRHLVHFRPDGSASGSNLTLLLCIPGQPEHALSVVVSNSGRIRGAAATPAQAASCAGPG